MTQTMYKDISAITWRWRAKKRTTLENLSSPHFLLKILKHLVICLSKSINFENLKLGVVTFSGVSHPKLWETKYAPAYSYRKAVQNAFCNILGDAKKAHRKC